MASYSAPADLSTDSVRAESVDKSFRILTFGDRISPGQYVVLSRFSRAVNLVRGDRLICLVDESVGAGPINIVVDGLELCKASHLTVQRDSLIVSGTALRWQTVFDSGLSPRLALGRAGLRSNLRRLRQLLVSAAPAESLAFLLAGRASAASGFQKALQERFLAAARELRNGRLAAGAAAMRGLGCGLTPSGDDFLAGYMWGLHVLGVVRGKDFTADIAAIHQAAVSGNALSRAFLACACEGRFFQRLKDTAEALFRHDEALLCRCARALLEVGATSGADTCAGLLFALQREESLWS